MAFPRALKAGNYSKPNQEGLGPERWVRGGPGNRTKELFPLTHSFLPAEAPSQGSSALVPQGSWAQPPAQQRSGTCFF